MPAPVRSEAVGSDVSAGGIVASALLVTSGDDLLVVQQVGDREVDAELASTSQTEAAADRGIEHKATLTFLLFQSTLQDVAIVVGNGLSRILTVAEG